MATTRVLVFKDSDDADEAVGKFKQNGYKVSRIGPTDKVEFKQDAESSITWISGSDAEWTIILATKDEITSGE